MTSRSAARLGMTTQRRVLPMVCVIAILLSTACAPLDALSPLTIRRAGMTEVEGDTLRRQRTGLHGQFAMRIGPGFEVLGARDFTIEGWRSLAPAYDVLRPALSHSRTQIPAQCQAEFRALGNPLQSRTYFIDGRCRYAVLETSEEPDDEDAPMILTLYDVAGAKQVSR